MIERSTKHTYVSVDMLEEDFFNKNVEIFVFWFSGSNRILDYQFRQDLEDVELNRLC